MSGKVHLSPSVLETLEVKVRTPSASPRSSVSSPKVFPSPRNPPSPRHVASPRTIPSPRINNTSQRRRSSSSERSGSKSRHRSPRNHRQSFSDTSGTSSFYNDDDDDNSRSGSRHRDSSRSKKYQLELDGGEVVDLTDQSVSSTRHRSESKSNHRRVSKARKKRVSFTNPLEDPRPEAFHFDSSLNGATDNNSITEEDSSKFRSTDEYSDNQISPKRSTTQQQQDNKERHRGKRSSLLRYIPAAGQQCMASCNIS